MLPAEQEPRLQPGAYVQDGTRLYEVIGFTEGPSSRKVILENCATGDRDQVDAYRLRDTGPNPGWKLVKVAPVVPEPIDALEPQAA